MFQSKIECIHCESVNFWVNFPCPEEPQIVLHLTWQPHVWFWNLKFYFNLKLKLLIIVDCFSGFYLCWGNIIVFIIKCYFFTFNQNLALSFPLVSKTVRNYCINKIGTIIAVTIPKPYLRRIHIENECSFRIGWLMLTGTFWSPDTIRVHFFIVHQQNYPKSEFLFK